MDITFGLTGMMWIGIAIFLGVLGWGFLNMGLTAGTKKGLKVGAVASILIATVALGYWAATPEKPTGDISGVVWDITVTESDTDIIKMSDTSFKVLCTWDISDAALTAATSNATFTFTLSRADTNIIDATTIGRFTDYGTKTNVTTSQSYDGIEKNADGSFNVVYTSSQSDATTKQIVVPYDKTLSTDTFTLLVTPNANAIAASTLQDGFITTFTIGSQTITFEFVHYATQA